MKIIDLLNKIANGEEVPKKIKYDQFVYVWNSKIENYQREIDEITTLNWDYIAINCLNEPVEILNKILEEEKKIPEKLPTWFSLEMSHNKEDNIEYANANFENMYEKINEICDYLKSKGDK